MRICIVTPAPPRSRHGNRVTALRWSRILRGLGHRVTVDQHYSGQNCDVLLALHAKRSADDIERFRKLWPNSPLVLALNPDTKVEPDFVERLLPAFDDPTVGIAAGKLLRFDRRTIDSAGQELSAARRPRDRG